jgi:hypothetical protein
MLNHIFHIMLKALKSSREKIPEQNILLLYLSTLMILLPG